MYFIIIKAILCCLKIERVIINMVVITTYDVSFHFQIYPHQGIGAVSNNNNNNGYDYLFIYLFIHSFDKLIFSYSFLNNDNIYILISKVTYVKKCLVKCDNNIIM